MSTSNLQFNFACRTQRILIVDDDKTLCLSLQKILELQGYEVITANDGASGIELFKSSKPDLILLDLMMPGMDGYETCLKLSTLSMHYPMPIVILSSLDTQESMRRAFDSGATDYLLKPVNTVLLSEKISRLLRDRDTELALQDSRKKLSFSQQLAGMGYWEYDTETSDFYPSIELKLLLGLDKDYKIETLFEFFKFVHRQDRKQLASTLRNAIDKKESFVLEHRMVDLDGLEYIVQHQGNASCNYRDNSCILTCMILDITERRDTQAFIENQQFYDKLTSLPNRLLFTDRLTSFMAKAEKQEKLLGVLFLGIDRFKNINDALGHAIGDALLQAIAERLLGADEHIEFVARFSGDVFSILVGKVNTVNDIELIAHKIREFFTKPFIVENSEFYLSVSIGCAIHPLSYSSRDELIKSAEAAMNHAKNAGGNRYIRFSAEMDRKVSRLLSLETNLRKAIDREEFEVYYQPQVAVHNGRIIGAEALVRWARPGVGVVPPDEFIGLAEETGLIVPIGSWVLNEAGRQVSEWVKNDLGMLRVGINLSARQFEERNLFNEIENVISNTGVSPCCLEMEITESCAMKNLDQTIATLNKLKELGVLSSMDDFGTGYSSLSYINKIPLHTLKIDRAFIMNITDDGKNSELARIIIMMAHALGLNVIAEGVETESQMNFLLENSCNEAQGYHIGRPVTATEFTRIIESRNTEMTAPMLF